MGDEVLLTEAEAESVLVYWISGDPKVNYNTKWFPSSNKYVQDETDNYITKTYSHLLFRALEIESFCGGSMKASLATIIVLDQFSRHIFRVLDEPTNSEKRRDADKKALKICEDTIGFKDSTTVDKMEIIHVEKQHYFSFYWDKELNVSEFIFFLMPFRHSATISRLEYVLDCIEERKRKSVEEINLLDKFRAQTCRRLQGLYDIEKSHCFNGSILEREAFVTTENGIMNSPLIKSVHKFLSRNLKSSTKNNSWTLFLSLSGGVDSMVLCKILMLLKLRKREIDDAKDAYDIGKIVCMHIDYANRPESAAEADFVKDWCDSNALVYNGGGFDKIVFRKRVVNEVRRGITDRVNYEKVSREIRYDFYKEILQEFESESLHNDGSCGVIFGHHKGDVQENVISNVMKGASPLELAGMSESTVANGVMIWRPLLQHPKTDIYDFAHQWGIPYLKDSTPSWSTRGKIRTRLMPLLAEIYGDGYLNNLSRMAQASKDAGTVMKSNVFRPFLQSIHRYTCGVCVNVVPFVDQPISFWKEMLKEVMHSMGMNMVRDAGVKNFVDRISRFAVVDDTQGNYNFEDNCSYWKKEGWLELRKGFFTYLKNNGDLIVFLHGLLLEPSCRSDCTQNIYYVVSNSLEFSRVANYNRNISICFMLDGMTAELYIRGWQIYIGVDEETKLSNVKFEEDFFEYLLRGNFEYKVNYLSSKKPLVGLIFGNKIVNSISDLYSYEEIGDAQGLERKNLCEENLNNRPYSIQYPSAFKNVNNKLKRGLPLLNFVDLSDRFDEYSRSGGSSEIGEEATRSAVFRFRFVGSG